MKECKEVLRDIFESGRVEHVSINITTSRLEFCEVTEATFDELAKVNEVYPIDLVEGYDSDNISIFFK